MEPTIQMLDDFCRLRNRVIAYGRDRHFQFTYGGLDEYAVRRLE